MTDIVSQLKDIVDENGLLTGQDVSDRMIHMWYPKSITALCIVRPTTSEQVARILQLCNDNNQTVVPHGGLTGLVQGCNSEPTDVVLSLERMNQIEEIDPIGRTITVQAGVPLQLIQETAEKSDLMFPLDLGARGSCQIGGNVSTNAGGNRVIRFGMARENVLGLEAVLADGTVMSSLNVMIKNNSGYDLKQLFIGTEGTLGIITRVVLRLREIPQIQPTAFAAFNDFSQVTKFLRFVDRKLGGELSAFEVMWHDYYEVVTTAPADNIRPVPADYPLYVLIESMGAASNSGDNKFDDILGEALEKELVADAAVAQSEADRMAMWKIRDSVEHFFRHGHAFLYDVSLAIRCMDDYVGEVKRRLLEKWPDSHCQTLGHIADGNIHFAIAVGDDSTESHKEVNKCVYEPLQPINGAISAEHGIGTEKLDYLGLSRSEEEIQIMQLLKKSLDPNNILNPEKIFTSRD